MKPQLRKILSVLFIVVLLILGIPFLINECYKHGGYVTLWDAADVLSYYGTVIGAAVTIATLWGTIVFTRKQIHHDSYLREEKEKWMKIETVFAEALSSLNPIGVLTATLDNGLTDPTTAIILLQKYQMACRTATDKLNAYLNIIDYPKVKTLLDGMVTASAQYVQISQELVDEYSKFRLFTHRRIAQETLNIEAKSPGAFSPETILFCQNVLRDTDAMRLEDIEKNVAKCNGKFVAQYESSFKELLRAKGSTFEIISNEIQKQADAILYFWRKN